MEKTHICKKCGGIAGWDSYFQSWICTRCGNEEPKTITNADRIRGMTDEELAEKIGESIDCEVCKTMHHSEGGECPCRPHQSCVGLWLDWLKEEVKE